MYTQSWLPLLLIALLFGILISNPWMVIFSSTLMVVMGAASLWSRYSLHRVQYARHWKYVRGFPGEDLPIEVSISNHKLLPVSWVRVEDRLPMLIAPQAEGDLQSTHIPGEGALVSVCSLRWREKVTRSYNLHLRQRGLYQVGPALLESGDIFGFNTHTQRQTDSDYVTVFPELLPINPLQIKTDNPFGDIRTRRWLFEDPNRTMGVRAYQPEDDFRHIHWNATAHTGVLQSRVYEPISAQVMVVCLNITTSDQSWLVSSEALFEQLIKMAATVCYQSFEQGYAVGCVSNGCLAHADHLFQIPPSRAPGQPAFLLESLAAVTSYTLAPFETYLMNTASRLAYGASLVVVTARVTEKLIETLVRLRRFRAHTTLISLAQDPPPPIPGVTGIHLPFEEPQE